MLRREAGSWFHACGPATEKALEPANVDTRGTSYCLLSADRRCALPGNVESVARRRPGDMSARNQFYTVHQYAQP